MAQRKSHDVNISKCICDNPGFCPVFNRVMGENPPDWKWCQNTCSEDRNSYYNLLAKAPPSDNYNSIELLRKLKESNLDNKFYLLYYLTLNDKYQRCDYAQKNQELRNQDIVSYILKQESSIVDLNDIEIVCLGHSDKQFNTIEDRGYLTKVNLNNIDAGEYSGNKWAEARAFLSKDIFKKNTKFVGLTTASWNIKYENYSRIDNFHNWYSARILLNSKPEDKIVLCADVFCPCNWFDSRDDILCVFFKEYAKIVGRLFSKATGINFNKHIKVPFSNQMILHRDMYQKYVDFLRDNEICYKVDFFIEKIAKKYLDTSNRDTVYAASRVNAYFMEMISTFWFANQDFIYIPNAERKIEWYSNENVTARIAGWQK